MPYWPFSLSLLNLTVLGISGDLIYENSTPDLVDGKQTMWVDDVVEAKQCIGLMQSQSPGKLFLGVSMKKKLLIAFFALLSIGIVFLQIGKVRAQPVPSGHVELKILVGDLERRSLVHLPPEHDKINSIPLVVMLHGMGGTAANAMRETGWSAKADLEGFIVVYPEATRPNADKPPSLRSNAQSWNDGSGRFHSAEQNIDDVAFQDWQLAAKIKVANPNRW